METKTTPFRQGFNDYRERKEPKTDGMTIGEQEKYENGRFFAIYCDVEGVEEPWKLLSFHLQQSKAMGYTR